MNLACVFSLDDSYVLPFKVFFDSICQTNGLPSECRVVIIHTETLCLQSIKALEEFILWRGFSAVFVDASCLIPANLPINEGDHVSVSTFYRLFVAEILPDEIDVAVYLDCDMIAVRSIRDLFSIDLGEDSLLAAVDHYAPAQAMRIWGDCGGSYFQAGVLVIPVKRWRQYSLSAAFINAMTEDRDRIQWWDQDVLNLVIGNNWTRLPIWLNVCHSHVQFLHGNEIENKACIIHYSGAEKPWNAYASSRFNHHWDAAFESLFGHVFNRKSLAPPRFPRLQYYRARLLARIRREP